jgi:hypothetical protein
VRRRSSSSSGAAALGICADATTPDRAVANKKKDKLIQAAHGGASAKYGSANHLELTMVIEI